MAEPPAPQPLSGRTSKVSRNAEMASCAGRSILAFTRIRKTARERRRLQVKCRRLPRSDEYGHTATARWTEASGRLGVSNDRRDRSSIGGIVGAGARSTAKPRRQPRKNNRNDAAAAGRHGVAASRSAERIITGIEAAQGYAGDMKRRVTHMRCGDCLWALQVPCEVVPGVDGF